jgi:Ni/Co efflux regulator RcnB
MTRSRYLSSLVFTTLCALGSIAHAAEQPSVSLDRPGAGVREIKKGDNVPDEYQRDSLAVKDWKQRHLAAPEKNQQWVEIQGKYALVNVPTGTILEMIDKSKVAK